jgi:hypothetical protein
MNLGRVLLTGKLPVYATGSIVANFVSNGGGKPEVMSEGTGIAADGTFSLLAWDNGDKRFFPSQTTFILQVGDKTHYATSIVVLAVEGSDKSIDISNAFAAAPKP